MNAGMRVPELFHHLLDHAADYRALVFTPYPFWVTFACSQVAPERSVLWTCLHDEPYAYLELFQPLFTGVGGLLFQTTPEHELAHRIHRHPGAARRGRLRGRGPGGYDPEGFRRALRHRPAASCSTPGGARAAKGWDDAARRLRRRPGRRDLPVLAGDDGRRARSGRRPTSPTG